jgi:glyceraldehyde 3-phosphate dehydrogenase
MANVAINGLGRIGRAALKIIHHTPHLEVAAVNDLVPIDALAYLLKYDTIYGRYGWNIATENGSLVVDGTAIRVLNEKDPELLPWEELKIDIVLECTGRFIRRADLEKHLIAGARAVILSAPSKSAEIVTVVHAVNQSDGDTPVISCASCTTNCVAPVAEIMVRRFGVKKAVMTTIHAYTATQNIVDGPAAKIRRGRAGAANLVPTSTGAAVAAAKTIPPLAGKFDGVAVRAPVALGSLSDIVFVTERPTTVEEVNAVFTEESHTDRYKGILGVTEDPIVSSDIIKDHRASVVDLGMTQVIDGDLVKIMSWYDNEWGYTHQMIREALRMTETIPFPEK